MEFGGAVRFGKNVDCGDGIKLKLNIGRLYLSIPIGVDWS